MERLGRGELLVILKRARALLSDPRGWSPRHYAEDESGRWVPVGSSQAARFNLEGALVHAAGRDARGAIAAIFEIFAAIAPEALQRLRRLPTSELSHSEAVSLLDQTMEHLTGSPARKRSGMHPIAKLTDDRALPEAQRKRS